MHAVFALILSQGSGKSYRNFRNTCKLVSRNPQNECTSTACIPKYKFVETGFKPLKQMSYPQTLAMYNKTRITL